MSAVACRKDNSSTVTFRDITEHKCQYNTRRRTCNMLHRCTQNSLLRLQQLQRSSDHPVQHAWSSTSVLFCYTSLLIGGRARFLVYRCSVYSYWPEVVRNGDRFAISPVCGTASVPFRRRVISLAFPLAATVACDWRGRGALSVGDNRSTVPSSANAGRKCGVWTIHVPSSICHSHGSGGGHSC